MTANKWKLQETKQTNKIVSLHLKKRLLQLIYMQWTVNHLEFHKSKSISLIIEL